MDSPRLTCPSVWSKKILASRREVEENYSHGLRRWAGYQRYRLQMDEGKSAEPFRQILELMIRDAERRADVIDMNLSNTGDASVGVLGRINNFEKTHYWPGLEKLMMRIADIKESIHRMNRSHNNHEGISRNIASSTEKVKEAWVKLQRERTLHLAENLSEFVTCLESCRGGRDNNCQMDIFSARPMKIAFEKLYPLWKHDVEKQIVNAPTLQKTDSGCGSSRSGIHVAATPPQHQCRCPDDVEGRMGSEKRMNVSEKEESSPEDDCARIIYLPTCSRRYPTSLTNFTAIPVMIRGNDKDVPNPANHSCNLKQVVEMMSRKTAHKMPEYRRTLTLGLPQDCLLPAEKNRLPIPAEGSLPTAVKLRMPNPNQVTAERLRQFRKVEKHSFWADGGGSRLNSNQTKSSLRKHPSVVSKSSFTKYPKLPSIPSNMRSSKVAVSKSSKLPVVQSKAAPISESRSLIHHKAVSLYRYHKIQTNRKPLRKVKNEAKPVVKAITVRLPSPA